MKRSVTILLLLLPFLALSQCNVYLRLIDVISVSTGGQAGCWDTAQNFGPVIYIEADTSFHYWAGQMWLKDIHGNCFTPFAVGQGNNASLFSITQGSCPMAQTNQLTGMGWSPYTGIWSGALAAAYFTRPYRAPSPSWQIWPYHDRLYLNGRFHLYRSLSDPSPCTVAVTFIIYPCSRPMALPEPDTLQVSQQLRPYATGPGWISIQEPASFQLSDIQGRSIAAGTGPKTVNGLATGIYTLLIENTHRKIHIP